MISSNLKPLSSKSVSGIKNRPYTGEAITLDLKIKGLVEDEDYYVEYSDNIDVGTAHVKIVGMGDYVGSISKTFKITPVSLTAKNTIVSGLPDEVDYSGVCEPEVSLTYGNRRLIEGSDYVVNFKNNDKAGKAIVTFKGIGNYSGSFNKTFKINAIVLSENTVTIAQLNDQPYEKGGNKPDLVITDRGNRLVVNKDYTLSYKNNTKQGVAKVTVKGKGNYKGTLTREFVIVASDLSHLKTSAPDKVYVNKKGNFKSALTITDVNGKKLVAGTDYEKTLEYSVDGEAIDDKAILQAGTIVTVTAKGKGNYQGEISAQYRIVQSDIAKAKVKVASQIYSGKEIEVDKAEISVKLNKTQLNAEDFEIVSYENNINKGTAKLTIKGLGNYGGTKTVSFKIVQKSFISAFWFMFNR